VAAVAVAAILPAVSNPVPILLTSCEGEEIDPAIIPGS